MARQPLRMSKTFILCGFALLAVAALAAGAAVVFGSLQWLGALAPFGPSLPPQSLVVGGLFLGAPVAAFGWGLVWFGRWLQQNA